MIDIDLSEKKILDMTCGSRTIWFNKNHPAAIYCDKRREDFGLCFGKAHTSLHQLHVNPDIQCDFTNIPLPDDSFSLVIFDPPPICSMRTILHGLLRNTASWMRNGQK